MRYEMSQAELIEAVQFYLNERVLRRPIKVSKVAQQEKKHGTVAYALHVVVTDDQDHMDPKLADAVRESAA